ncbi:MAG: hypothetical protein QGD94_04925, partial [Planctomycetia bacterium]|nr:hypothetical protein [Planctomycetia bacterium]
MTKSADNKPADNDKPPKGRRRKRRRGLRVLLVLLSLASAIWASPYLASTGIGTRLVLAIANSRLQGEVRIAELSLSWLGPCEIGGLRALDPSGRTVLDVTRIRLDRGVWHLLTAAEDFGDVGIDSPRVFLYISPDGGVSISRAFSSPDEARPDAEPEEPEEEALPSPRGKVTWHSGEVTIIRADGRALRLRDVGGQLELYTLNDIVASFTAALDGDPSGPPRDSRSGGVLTGDIEFKGLVWRGKICPQRLNGSASLRSDEDMDITEAVLFATGIAGVEGKAGVDARFALGPGNMQGDLAVRLTGLSAGRPGEATRLEPIDLAIIASAVRGKGAISGQLDVSGTPATLAAKFS